MAFYFALLNVSAKREDRNASSSSHRQKRRRHSIASIESPILDYRLLPRPQVVRNEFYHTDHNESEVESSRQRDHRSASYSRLCDEASEREQNVRRTTKRYPKEIKYKKIKKSSSSQLNTSKKQKSKMENGLEKEFMKMHITSSTSRRDNNNETNRAVDVAEASSSRVINSTMKTTVAKTNYKWRGKRPIVVKRRASPQTSSTSGSRRSSNLSTLSPPRNDSVVSSNSSTRVSETIPEAAPSGQSSPTVNSSKMPNASMATKLCDLPRSATLKKVTFENDASQLFASNAFLGDRRVLIRRSSGSTIHHPSITQPLSPSTVPMTLRPLAEGTAALAELAYGAALWAPFSTGTDETPKGRTPPTTLSKRHPGEVEYVICYVVIRHRIDIFCTDFKTKDFVQRMTTLHKQLHKNCTKPRQEQL